MQVLKCIRNTALMLAAALMAGQAGAQAWPAKPIHLIVPYAAGGQTDVLARVVGNEIQRISSQQIVVENKPGASGVVAIEYIVNSGADGYSVCFCTPTNIFAPAILDPNTRFDPLKTMTPVIQLFDAASLIAARPGLQATTLKDVIAMAKAKPHELTFGSIGTGTKAPYTIELLVSMAGTDFNMVSYKGEQPVATDLLADRVDLGYLSIPTALPHVKAGKLKVIAVMAPGRLPSLPDVATVTETVPGYEAPVFFGLFVPNGTPRAAIDKLNEFGAAAVATPTLQERMRAESLFPVAGKPEAFAARVRSDAERWNKLMK